MTWPTREDRVSADFKDVMRRVGASDRLIKDVDPPLNPGLDWLLLLVLILDLGVWVGLLAWWIWR